MTTNWDDDLDEIVVDDKPREDGLSGEDEFKPQASASAQHELARITTAIPLILQRLDALLDRINGMEDRLGDLSPPTQRSSLQEEVPSVNSPEETSAALDAPVAGWTDSPSTREGEEPLIEKLIFGKTLCQDPALDRSRQQLLAGVVASEATAIGLASRLMLVRAASAEELPPLLKEVGEAYYRRHPKTCDTSDPLESSLVADLTQRISAVGLRNSIELVHPGDRYDAIRHISPDRGVAVTETRGWVVLRENGKPLTKAAVSLR